LAEIIQRSKWDSEQLVQGTKALKLLVSDGYERAYRVGTAPMERPSAQKEDDTTLKTEVMAQWKVLSPKDAGTLIHLLLDLPYEDEVHVKRRLRFELEGLEYDPNAESIDTDISMIYQHAETAREALNRRFGTFKTSYSEHPFEAFLTDLNSNKSGTWVRGTIDLLAQTEAGMLPIIDSTPAQPKTSERKAYVRDMGYDRQLKFYQKAMKSMSNASIHVDDKDCLILFTGLKEDQWISLADL
jgi:hypothetical protein